MGENDPSASSSQSAARPSLSSLSSSRHAPGESVGYGRRYVATDHREIALLPIGYADGYPSAASGSAQVLVHGRRVPVVGAVSMDLTSVDVTGLGVQVGDQAVLLGAQGSERIDVLELARWSRSVPYECLCRLSRRMRPTYLGAD